MLLCHPIFILTRMWQLMNISDYKKNFIPIVQVLVALKNTARHEKYYIAGPTCVSCPEIIQFIFQVFLVFISKHH